MVPLARTRRRRRRGNVVVLCAFLMVALMAMVAFAVDLGYIFVARDQLQRSADASALAAAWELVDADGPQGDSDVFAMLANANSVAREYAAYNPVLKSAPQLGNSDVSIGYIDNPFDPACPLSSTGVGEPNAVRVRVRRTAAQNGDIPLFFARAIGVDRASAQAEATAVLINSVAGFRMPGDGTNLQILPFSLDEATWRDLVDNDVGGDQWRWNPDTKKVVPGIDGIKEVNLYPRGTGSSRHRGTLDIGGANHSASDVARQIIDGISAEDLEHLAGKLALDETGELPLHGDTGISAGVQDDLASIIGQPRIIPIFRVVQGPGSSATYTVVQWGGVRVMDVKLTGSIANKRVIIQPCNIVAKGGIPATGHQTSSLVYSPVWLIR